MKNRNFFEHLISKIKNHFYFPIDFFFSEKMSLNTTNTDKKSDFEHFSGIGLAFDKGKETIHKWT